MQNFFSKVSKIAPAKQLLMQPVRTFNKSVRPPTVSNNGAYLFGGLAVGGMSYLAW